MPDPGPPPDCAGSPWRDRLPPGRVRAVVLYPDPVLRAVCAPAAQLAGPARAQLVADLTATVYAAGGRGLAAPQIGVARRALVMDAGWKDGAPTPIVMLDPVVLARSADTLRAEERCLSIPDHPVQVDRPACVRLRWFDPDGQAHERDLSGTEARIALHEIDHLDGVLILDHESGTAPARAEDRPHPADAPDGADA